MYTVTGYNYNKTGGEMGKYMVIEIRPDDAYTTYTRLIASAKFDYISITFMPDSWGYIPGDKPTIMMFWTKDGVVDTRPKYDNRI